MRQNKLIELSARAKELAEMAENTKGVPKVFGDTPEKVDQNLSKASAKASAGAASQADKAASLVNPDTYLILSAKLALDTLRELHSPGIALLESK